MTCTCGAKMCYICKAKGVDYDHFYGQVVLFPMQGSLFFLLGLETTLCKTPHIFSEFMKNSA